MKITKNLKYCTFEYDEETKSFLIIDTEDGGVVELNKIYAFAFMRFVVRMAQRNWLRGKKRVDNKGNTVVSLEKLKEESENPHQLTWNEIEEEDQWQ